MRHLPAIGSMLLRHSGVGIAVGALLLFWAPPAISQVKVPLALRYQASIQGNMTMVGNNVLSVTPTGNYNGSSGNHYQTTVYVDIDNDTTTFNSSNATLALPPDLTCLEIRKAFLYWAAADLEDPGNEPAWLFSRVKFRLPTDTAYRTLDADQVIYQGRLEHFYNDPYVCFKDITSLLPDSADGTYWMANVKAKKGTLQSHGGGNTGTSGGWIIVFIYESADLPPKNIALFDGYVHMAMGVFPNPLPVTFSGFQTVPSGNVNIDFLMGSLEGDWDLTGDYCHIQRVDGTWLSLSSPLRQTNNFFHSIIGLDSSHFLARYPASQNTLGFDADKFPIPNAGNAVIGNNQTSATLRMGTNQEIYGLFLTGLAVDVWNPAILSIFHVPAMPGGTGDSVQAGDTVLFRIETRNTGNDDATNLLLSTNLPPGLEFIQTIPPLPSGVNAFYDPSTTELSFFVNDSLVETGDTSFEIRYLTRAIDDCLLLLDSATAHPSCQLNISFRGAVNTILQTATGSTAVNKCGRGNGLPVSFTIMPPLSVPVARNDTATTAEDTPIGIAILANDDDCDNNIDTSSVAIVVAPLHGQVKIIQPGGGIMYQPGKNYFGFDSLYYAICDQDGQCDTAVVNIHVLPVNDPPLIVNEYFMLCQDTLLTGNILMNDADTADNTEVVAIMPPVVQASHGLLQMNASGNFTYLPNAGFSGSDFAVVRVCDTGFPLPPQCVNDTLFFTVGQFIQAHAGQDLTLCNTTEAVLTGNNPSPGTGSWLWIEGPDTAVISANGQGSATAGGLIPGVYRFEYVIDNGECTSSDTMFLFNLDLPSSALGGPDQVVCFHEGDSLIVTLQAIQPVIGSGKWSQHSGPSSVTFANPHDPVTLIAGLMPGVYKLLWQTIHEPCPPNTDTVRLTVNRAPSVYAGPDRGVCASSPVILDDAVATNFTAVGWTTSGLGIFSNPAVLHPEYHAEPDTGSAAVMLILTVSPLEACEAAYDTVILRISAPPVANAGPGGSICTGTLFQLQGSVSAAAGNFSWSHSGSGMLLNPGTMTPLYQPGMDEEGAVTVVLTSTGKEYCLNDTVSDQAIINIYEIPVVYAGSDTSFSVGTELWLSGQCFGGTGNYTYHWIPESVFDDPFRSDPHITGLSTDTLLILRVTDNVTGCEDADSLYVNVTGNNPFPGEECIRLYNTLTPNGDGLNDVWIIDCIETFPSNRLVILDRWGDMIAEFENYNNHSVVWKGTGKNGETIPDGTYYYILTIRDGDTHAGWILVRSGSQ